MSQEYIFTGNYVRFMHERLNIFGLLFREGIKLDEIHELFPKIEFAQVKKAIERDFLAGFCMEPIIDLTFVKLPNLNGSIVAYTLQETEAEKVIEDIVKAAGFITRDPTYSFADILGSEFPIEKESYESSQLIANVTENDVEKVFGAVRYSSFLINYKGLPENESMGIASKKFGIHNIPNSR